MTFFPLPDRNRGAPPRAGLFVFFRLKSGGFRRRRGLGGRHHFSATFIQIRRDGLGFAAIFRLIATFRAIRAFLPFRTLAILRLITTLLVLLMLHRGLVHGVQDAEVMLRMLEIAFRHHAIPAAGRIAPKLEVFFEKLLRRAAQPQIRAVRIKNVVAVKRLAATLAATPATMAELAAPTMSVTAPAAHALHVHLYCVSLFRLRQFRAQRASALNYVLKSESVASKRCRKGCINQLPFGIREGNRTSALTAGPF
jgi:hypothetical protein